MSHEDTPNERDSDGRDAPGVPARNDSVEGGNVLSPEELDISESEYVEQLNDSGRYVVSPGGGPPNVPRSQRADSEADRRDSRERTRPERSVPAPVDADSPVSPEAARTLLAEELARTDASYGIDIVARFEGETVRHRTVSNDVVGTFEDLVRWYARHVTDETPVDEVIDILLREARFGTGSEPNLAELLDAHDLGTDDSIADLVEAIRSESKRDR